MRKRPQGQRPGSIGGTDSRGDARPHGKSRGAGKTRAAGPPGEKPRRIEMRFPEARGDIVDKDTSRGGRDGRGAKKAPWTRDTDTRKPLATSATRASGAPGADAPAGPRVLRTSTGARREASGRPTEDMRIAKAMARAGLCSRREAERWILEGRVKVNGEKISSPALDVGPKDRITVDNELLPDAEPPRLWRYHKPRGLVTTHKDPEGRPTVFDAVPREIGRVISVGRLDYNTEGLLLLTNDGALARHLELPTTGWLRRYRVRAHGVVTQERLDTLKGGIEIEGVQYGPIEATLDSVQGANIWLTLGLREGKNREVRNILNSLGLLVNRLIRISYGPFQLLDLEEGTVESIKRRVLEEQLGPVLSRELNVTLPETATKSQPSRGTARVRPRDDDDDEDEGDRRERNPRSMPKGERMRGGPPQHKTGGGPSGGKPGRGPSSGGRPGGGARKR